MATSLRDLLTELEHTLRVEPSQLAADDAVAALVHLGRALTRLGTDGLRTPAGGGRETAAVAELARACRAASTAWIGLPHGRITDLSGAAADVLGRIRSELGANERWAAAIELSTAARRCVSLAEHHSPYARVPPLTRVRRLAIVVEQLATAHPPQPHRQGALDRLIPVAGLPRGMPGSRIAAESAAVVGDHLRRAAGDPARGPVRVVEVLAALLAAESTASYATAVAAAFEPTTREQPPAQAPDAWRAVRRALDYYDDGTRHHPGQVSRLILWAVRQHEGLGRELGAANSVDSEKLRDLPELPRVLSDLRAAANQLPDIAGSLQDIVQQWARRGQLVARATDLGRRDERIRAIIASRAATVDTVDFADTLDVLRLAGLLSTALAVQLDAVAADIGEHPQPHLAASHAATLASPRVAEDLNRRALLVRLSPPNVSRHPVPHTLSPSPLR